MKDKFKMFGGEFIPDIVEYIRDYINENPTATLSVGCDSVQLRRKTLYAITIMLYDNHLKNGAHVVFYRESHPKLRDNNERLMKEAQYLHDLGIYLDGELSKTNQRKDLNEWELKRYKYHTLRCDGEYGHVKPQDEFGVIKNLTLTDSDRINWKFVDIHVDFNPYEGRNGKNKSNLAYRSYVPWLKALGFRVWAKPMAYCSTSAADLLLKNK